MAVYKLLPQFNIVDFLQKAQRCSGEVYFETDEGDRLNICSQLSQMIFASILRNEQLRQNGRIRLSDEEDYPLLGNFLQPLQ